MQTPAFEPAFGDRHLGTTFVRAGERPEPNTFKPGDVVLGRAHKGFRRWVIAFGQGMRIRRGDRRFIDYTHAAVIVDEQGNLIEAVGTGVWESSLSAYAIQGEEYLIVDINASDADRAHVVRFARWARRHRSQYGRLATVSIFFSQLTGTKFAFFIDGEFHCSGLVARALERTDALFTKDPVHVMPADLAKYLNAPQAVWATARRKRLFGPHPAVERVREVPRALSAPAPPVIGRRVFGTRSTGGTRPSWWRGKAA